MTTIRGRVAVLAITGLAATAACGSEDPEPAVSAGSTTTTTAAASDRNGAVALGAQLSGASEAPAAGDPDGSGTATVAPDPGAGVVCFEVTVAGIDAPVGMHLHEGAVGTSGPIVVPLATPTAGNGTSTGCAPAAADLLGRITADPASFYLNVHTAAFPQGAVRGQLSAGAAGAAPAAAPAQPAPAAVGSPVAAPATTSTSAAGTPTTQRAPSAPAAPAPTAASQPAPTPTAASPAASATPTLSPPATAAPVTAPPATSPPATAAPPPQDCDYPPCY